jgi:hypothetical protein
LWATCSNCGESLKLQLPSYPCERVMARLVALGMVTMLEDVTMGYPQPTLSGREGGSETKWAWVWLCSVAVAMDRLNESRPFVGK